MAKARSDATREAPQLRVTNLEEHVIDFRQQITEEIERARERERYFANRVRETVELLRSQRRQLAQLQDELEREAQPTAAE